MAIVKFSQGLKLSETVTISAVLNRRYESRKSRKCHACKDHRQLPILIIRDSFSGLTPFTRRPYLRDLIHSINISPRYFTEIEALAMRRDIDRVTAYSVRK